jgi:hypothetical protein
MSRAHGCRAGQEGARLRGAPGRGANPARHPAPPARRQRHPTGTRPAQRPLVSRRGTCVTSHSARRGRALAALRFFAVAYVRRAAAIAPLLQPGAGSNVQSACVSPRRAHNRPMKVTTIATCDNRVHRTDREGDRGDFGRPPTACGPPRSPPHQNGRITSGAERRDGAMEKRLHDEGSPARPVSSSGCPSFVIHTSTCCSRGAPPPFHRPTGALSADRRLSGTHKSGKEDKHSDCPKKRATGAHHRGHTHATAPERRGPAPPRAADRRPRRRRARPQTEPSRR